ncbi:(2Fe-2S)-binding protein [Polymorphobacter sp.]|uniref:(2Fe-2S)-binding protein n=1 Tax=Polymorphobacter sp. TaxID=1909290 RepID=UPI003F721B57
MTVSLTINGRKRSIEAEADMPLLWALRDDAGLKGTKFGCGVGVCGACTVLVDGVAIRSCSVSVGDVGTARIVTIEGLAGDGDHPLQKAWIAEQVPQCGYCQPGMIMAAAALIAETPRPSDTDINEQITNVCRCGTYPRIRRAIHRAAAEMAKMPGSASA